MESVHSGVIARFLDGEKTAKQLGFTAFNPTYGLGNTMNWSRDSEIAPTGCYTA